MNNQQIIKTAIEMLQQAVENAGDVESVQIEHLRYEDKTRAFNITVNYPAPGVAQADGE